MTISEAIVERYDFCRFFYRLTADHNKGTVYAYACETLSLTLLLKEFKYAIREGDGDRVMTVWMYFLLYSMKKLYH